MFFFLQKLPIENTDFVSDKLDKLFDFLDNDSSGNVNFDFVECTINLCKLTNIVEALPAGMLSVFSVVLLIAFLRKFKDIFI